MAFQDPSKQFRHHKYSNPCIIRNHTLTLREYTFSRDTESERASMRVKKENHKTPPLYEK